MLPVRLLLAALGGVALLLAFPGYDVWPLALVGCAALALVTAGARVRVGAACGLLLGLTWFTPMFAWAGTYAGAPPWLAMSAASALYTAALGALLAWLQRDGPVRPWVGAAAWVLMEWGRSLTPFGGFPWGRLAFSQGDSPLLGAAPLVAVGGVALLVALAGGLLARAVQLSLPGRTALSRRWPRVAAHLLGAAAVVLTPALVPRAGDGEPLSVAAVQGDIPEDFTRTLTADPGTMLGRYTGDTAALAGAVDAGEVSGPDVVLWPEGASDVDPLGPSGDRVRHQVEQASELVGAPVLYGATTRLGEPGAAPRNAVFQVEPGVGHTDRYDKVYLAPFGEVMPLRPVVRHLSPWVDRIVDFAPGAGPGLLDVPVGEGDRVRLGFGICFEVVMDPAVRDLVAGGAEVLVVPTSNAWFGEGDQSEQHLAISRVRAVEHGRAVVHISNVGVSGLIHPDGRVEQRTDLFTRDLVTGQVPRRSATTPALMTGPWVEPAALVLVLLGGLTGWRRRRG